MNLIKSIMKLIKSIMKLIKSIMKLIKSIIVLPIKILTSIILSIVSNVMCLTKKSPLLSILLQLMAMIVIFFFFVFITNDLHHASYFRGNVITNAIEMHLFQQLPPQQLPPQQLPPQQLPYRQLPYRQLSPFSEYLKAPKFSGPNLMESKVDQFSLSKQKLYTPDENYKMLKRLQHLHQNYFDQDRNDLELDRNDLELD